jgi:hypothetical protein
MEEGKWELAEADYQRALAHAPLEDVLAWYRAQAALCQARRQWSAALWYLDRLLRAGPEDQELRQQRADVAAKLSDE